MLIIYKDITAFWASPSLLSITKQLKFTIVDILEMVNTLREIEKNKDEADEDGCSILSTEESLTKTSIPDTITPNTDSPCHSPLFNSWLMVLFFIFIFYLLFLLLLMLLMYLLSLSFAFFICLFWESQENPSNVKEAKSAISKG